MSNSYFVGVDVGTGSARACLVNAKGEILKSATRDIKTWNPHEDHYEQSSDDIWNSVCFCVKQVVSDVDKSEVLGIGFDATCSLVVLDKEGKSLSVSKTNVQEQNIILWMDHRAAEEANKMNATNHQLLDFVGGKVSLEMECPKLMWVKKHLPEQWKNIGQVFDLPDYLTWRATNSGERSLCSIVCKWNFDALANRWSSDLMAKIGLSELLAENCHKIGNVALPPGSLLSQGISNQAAVQLGLLPGTAVGASIIDAHAGVVGLFTCKEPGAQATDVLSKMAIIGGTSTCHMSLTRDQLLVPGIWGPYKNVILPEMYLHEAGQSAAGILVDHLIKSHPAYESIQRTLDGKHIIEHLNGILLDKAKRDGWKAVTEMTKAFHIRPDFHGNRSPLADPNVKGMISGLTMKSDEQNLVVLYLATIQALAYGTRDILDTLIKRGRPEFKSILITGGLAKNELYVRCHADVCSLPVLCPGDNDMVLLGAALLGMAAAQRKNLEISIIIHFNLTLLCW